MRMSLGFVAAALSILVSAATPSIAAENSTTVKVALLDMSSQMPMGMTGYGMMGQGMMGPGMMGQGMMGPGMWGQGMMGPGMWGQGMMGPGMWGQGMMGPGMWGQGMMGGMMSIRVDRPVTKAGPVVFDVTNWSRSVLHEMLLVSIDNPAAPLPYDYAQARVPEEQVKVLGEVSELQPSESKTLELNLTPGTYLLFCNIAGHYAAGMAVTLNVTP